MNWLKRRNERVQEKTRELVGLLSQRGHKLGPPHAKFLRDGIWELRINVQRVPYRILYAFVGREVVLLTHGFKKNSIVPPAEIEKAIRYRTQYLQDPQQHSYRA